MPIEDVQVGDMVMTHRGRWRPVDYTWDRGVQPVVTVKGHGHPGLTVTADHKFWMDGGHFAHGTWKAPSPGDRWTTPWWFEPATVPPLPARTYAPGRPCNVPDDVTDPAFLWLYGLFVAEGSCSSSFGKGGTVNRVTYSVHDDEVDEVELVLRKVGLRFSTNRVGTERCHNIVINSRPLATWMSAHGGRGARNKHLSSWAFGVDDFQRKAILDGLAYGDGYTRGSGRVEYTTASKALATDVKLLAASLGYFATFTRSKGRTGVINGRTLVGGEQYVVGWYMNGRHNHINTVTPAGTARVYDLEVAEDHSFIAESIAVSNCARSVGKTLSIVLRMYAFPFLYPGQEAVITAPELVHLEPLSNLIEGRFYSSRLGREMLPHGRGAVTHRPFMMNFVNGARIMGRIPQRDGKGVKGCVGEGTLILTRDHGLVPVEGLQPGEHVLTHEGRWKPVKVVEVDVNDAYEVRGQGSFPMVVSCDHRFLGAENLATKKQRRRFGDLLFHDVGFLTEHQVHWATPTSFPELPIPEVPGLSDNIYFWWATGRWLADGYLSRDKKNNKGRKVHWTVRADKAADVAGTLRGGLGVTVRNVYRSHSSAVAVEVANSAWNRWLEEHFGQHADGKRLPTWMLGAPLRMRQALLDGYLQGDGHWNADRKRYECGTASKQLAVGLQLLAQSLSYTVNCTMVQPKPNPVCANPKPSWRLQLVSNGTAVTIGDYNVGLVRSVTSVGKVKVFNPVIEDDHSYLSGTIMSHNIHPIWLELDEAQDYPEAGWLELIETLKRGHEGAVWRAHGVTRGIRDKFYEFTQDTPGNRWRIHRFTAMHRPSWTDDERQEKIQQYRSRENPDYRRNVRGEHGDATNPLFVLHRLMKCVDDNTESDYNTLDYHQFRVNHEMLTDRGVVRDIVEFLSFPDRHKGHAGYWVGMDVGYTNHPSEILVFAEEKMGATNGLRLICRIHLERISNPQQVRAICWIMDFYKPKVFAMDRTGVGLPLFQDLQEAAPKVAEQIRGYNFSEKILVDFDEAVLATLSEQDDDIKEAGIQRNVLEYATDKLRELVDKQRIILPWDTELIGEFQGQTWSYSKEAMDMYGRRRRVYSQGSFHALDAARMAVLAFIQHKIEEMIRLRNVRDNSPVFTYIVDPGGY